MTTTVITTVSADDCDEWTDAVISNCFKSLNAAEDPARGNDTELALKQALTAFYVEHYVKIKTTEQLTRDLNEFCAQHGYTPMSADELIYEIGVGDAPQYQIDWLNRFIDDWDNAQKEEDNLALIRKALE